MLTNCRYIGKFLFVEKTCRKIFIIFFLRVHVILSLCQHNCAYFIIIVVCNKNIIYTFQNRRKYGGTFGVNKNKLFLIKKNPSNSINGILVNCFCNLII